MNGNNKIILGLVLFLIFGLLITFLKDNAGTLGISTVIILFILLVILKFTIINPAGTDLILKGKKENISTLNDLEIEDESLSDLTETQIREKISSANIHNTVGKDFSFRPILYLRSFVVDTDPEVIVATGGPSYIDTFEQQLQVQFNNMGPLLALANPGLDYLGTTKVHVGVRNWKIVFYTQVKSSQLVIWQWGLSNNLIWELNELLTISPQKLIIFFPVYIKPKENRQFLWDLTLQKLNRLGSNSAKLPKEIKEARFIIFRDNQYMMFEPEITLKSKLKTLGTYEEVQLCLKKMINYYGYNVGKAKLDWVHKAVLLLSISWIIFILTLLPFNYVLICLSIFAMLFILFIYSSKTQTRAKWCSTKGYIQQLKYEIDQVQKMQQNS